MTITEKKQILEAAGYWFNFERGLYLNRKERKAMSIEFFEDSDEERLREALATPAPSEGDWDFIFNTAPTPSIRRQLVSLLG